MELFHDYSLLDSEAETQTDYATDLSTFNTVTKKLQVMANNFHLDFDMSLKNISLINKIHFFTFIITN